MLIRALSNYKGNIRRLFYEYSNVDNVITYDNFIRMSMDNEVFDPKSQIKMMLRSNFQSQQQKNAYLALAIRVNDNFDVISANFKQAINQMEPPFVSTDDLDKFDFMLQVLEKNAQKGEASKISYLQFRIIEQTIKQAYLA